MSKQTLSSLVLLSGCAALVTVWVLRTAPPSNPPAVVAVSGTGAFLADRYHRLVADGSCQIQSDVGAALLATSSSDAPAEGPSSSPDSPAAEADSGAAPEPAVQAVPIAPIGGTCGGHLEPPAGSDIAPVDGPAPPPEPEMDVVEVEPTPVVQATVPPVVVPSSDDTVVAKKKAATQSRREASSPTADVPRSRRMQSPSKPLTAWWPASNPDNLNILFVGEAAFGSAISVLADGEFESAESANAHIQVRTADGARVDRKWQLATNRKMLLMSVGPGEYAVSIASDLSDAKSRTFGRASEGRVFVR